MTADQMAEPTAAPLDSNLAVLMDSTWAEKMADSSADLMVPSTVEPWVARLAGNLVEPTDSPMAALTARWKAEPRVEQLVQDLAVPKDVTTAGL